MKSKIILGLAVSLLVSANAAQAARIWEDSASWWDSHWVYVKDTPRFAANELSLDLFGSYINPERGIEEVFDTSIQEGKWGGGVGLNYFMTEHIGIGADFNAAENRGEFVDQVLGSVFLRLPIESIGLAPYVFGGGGRAFDPEWEWVGHAGVGLEFRFNPVTGIFADARWIWPEDTNEKLLLRAGLRLAF
ncbi:MAG TPA: hypothetical protein VN673_05840 [Clostridia bacterium]|nr:hypothetical protein [Clostridia bacterium]